MTKIPGHISTEINTTTKKCRDRPRHRREGLPQAAFYSYACPEPKGFRERAVTPGAYFDVTLGEFILPYDRVRMAADPDALLLNFLSTTYIAAADAGAWNRSVLECPIGAPARVRPI